MKGWPRYLPLLALVGCSWVPGVGPAPEPPAPTLAELAPVQRAVQVASDRVAPEGGLRLVIASKFGPRFCQKVKPTTEKSHRKSGRGRSADRWAGARTAAAPERSASRPKTHPRTATGSLAPRSPHGASATRMTLQIVRLFICETPQSRFRQKTGAEVRGC